jgi:hypothetical protein
MQQLIENCCPALVARKIHTSGNVLNATIQFQSLGIPAKLSAAKSFELLACLRFAPEYRVEIPMVQLG